MPDRASRPVRRWLHRVVPQELDDRGMYGIRGAAAVYSADFTYLGDLFMSVEPTPDSFFMYVSAYPSQSGARRCPVKRMHLRRRVRLVLCNGEPSR